MKQFAVEVPLLWEERGYHTTDFGLPVRAFLVRLPAGGGSIHRHTDCGDVDTLHFVLATNAGARNFWIDEHGQEQSMHMEQGKVYRVDRTLEHWARNDGDTDRVHLLVEYPK